MYGILKEPHKWSVVERLLEANLLSLDTVTKLAISIPSINHGKLLGFVSINDTLMTFNIKYQLFTAVR